MKKFTKTTIFGAVVAAAVGVVYMALGKGAAKADQIDEEVDDEFKSLDTTEDDIETDVIEPEEGDTPAENEEE